MQEVTYFGLRDLSRCIELRLLQLEDHASIANRITDEIIEYVKEEMGKYASAEVKNNVGWYSAFKRYLSTKRKEIYHKTLKSHNFFNLSHNIFELIFEEIYAYGLGHIQDHLYNELITNKM